MRYSTLRDVVITLVKQNRPVLITSSPGVGKTSLIEDVHQHVGDADLMVCHPVVDEPTDYKGLPCQVEGKDGTMVASFLPFDQLRALITAKRKLIFFLDDLGQAPPSVQAAIMQLVLARKLNGHRISDHVVFVAASNRRQDRAAVQGLITPLLDRFVTVLSLDFEVDDWASWALQQELPPELVAFSRFRADLINNFEASRDMKKQPTPRSVAGLGELMKLGLDQPEVMQGAVGDGFASEFMAFRDTWKNLPDIDKLMKNPGSTDVPTKPAVLYALMGAIAYRLTAKNFGQALKFLDRCPGEFSVLCVKDALHRSSELAESSAFESWVNKNAKLLGVDRI